MNTKPLCRINTMLMGHIVTADVVEVTRSPGKPENDTYHCAFVCHTETGKTEIWLDIGQGWKSAPGQMFTASKCNIDRAAELLRVPADRFEVTADDVTKIQLAIF